MNSTIWIYTLAFFGILLLLDVAHAWNNRNKVKTISASAISILFYVTLAIIFGILLPQWTSNQSQKAFFAGWLTEYSLSLDNLFVFILVFNKLKIQKNKQEIVLFFGITLSLILRGICLLLGVALVNRWSFMFFIFGSFLIYTAIQFIRDDGDTEWEENRIIEFFKERKFSLLTIAFISIASADLMFAFDSIPAIIGITTDPYVIITSNFFALMGLRQLYFLIEVLVAKLEYLSIGLSLILLFIGVKLIFESMLKYEIQQVLFLTIPEISLETSLLTILLILALTTLFSLLKKQKPKFPF